MNLYLAFSAYYFLVQTFTQQTSDIQVMLRLLTFVRIKIGEVLHIRKAK